MESRVSARPGVDTAVGTARDEPASDTNFQLKRRLRPIRKGTRLKQSNMPKKISSKSRRVGRSPDVNRKPTWQLDMKFNLSVVVGGEGSPDAGKKQGLGIDSDEPEGKNRHTRRPKGWKPPRQKTQKVGTQDQPH